MVDPKFPGFEQALFIGGTPCSGKSTLADLFALRHGFTVYPCDENYERHLESSSQNQPTLKRLQHRSWLEAMSQRLNEMIQTERMANLELGVLAFKDVQ